MKPLAGRGEEFAQDFKATSLSDLPNTRKEEGRKPGVCVSAESPVHRRKQESEWSGG
jgi:hypothetical protein